MRLLVCIQDMPNPINTDDLIFWSYSFKFFNSFFDETILCQLFLKKVQLYLFEFIGLFL